MVGTVEASQIVSGWDSVSRGGTEGDLLPAWFLLEVGRGRRWSQQVGFIGSISMNDLLNGGESLKDHKKGHLLCSR